MEPLANSRKVGLDKIANPTQPATPNPTGHAQHTDHQTGNRYLPLIINRNYPTAHREQYTENA